VVSALAVGLPCLLGCQEAYAPTDCDGLLDVGELCDDGNGNDGDGCDCAARLIAPAREEPAPGVPIVVAEDGAWCWFQDERAILIDSTLIVSSMGHGGDVQVASYDTETGERQQAVLHTRLERDDHDVASLLPLDDGRVAAYYTRHDGFPHLYARASVRAGDLTSWSHERVTSFPFDVTYTNAFRFAEEGAAPRIYLFFRGIDSGPTFIASDDDGATWSRPGRVIDAAVPTPTGWFPHRPYVKYATDGTGTIHLVYTDGHPNEYLHNSIYHLFLRDGALHRSDGTMVAAMRAGDSPALPPDAGTRVYDGWQLPGGQAWTWDAAIDGEGNPVAVFSTYPDPSRPFFDHRYRYARWDGGAWQVHDIARAGTGIYYGEGYYSGGIALDPDHPDTVYFAADADPLSGEPTATATFEIFRGVTRDGGATWSITPVTSGSTAHNLRPIVPRGHRDDTLLLWMQGSYDTYLAYETRIVALRGAADVIARQLPPPEPALVPVARFDLASTAAGPASPTAPGFVAAIPEAGVASAESGGITLRVRNVRGSRDAGWGDPLHRDLVYGDRGGRDPADKLTVELGGLVAGRDYVVRLHGHDSTGAYLLPTLWFRAGTGDLDLEGNRDFLGGHRNVNGAADGEGATDLVLAADDRGHIDLVARGLDDLGSDRVAVLNGVEVMERPATEVVARFDVDALPGMATAPGFTSLSFEEGAWSGSARQGGVTVTMWSDRIDSLRHRDSDDPLRADFLFGRDHLAVDVDGLEPGRLYEVTVHSVDLEQNLHNTSRWRLDEPGAAPVVVRGFQINSASTGPAASFVFYHRARASRFRLIAHDVMSSLSTDPSVVIVNGIELRVAP
jgi:putative BNR repeat neuraminidase